MADQKQTLIAKLAGIGAALLAAWAAQQLINALWTRGLGHRPPKPEDEDVRFAEIAIAAAVTGAAIALARVLATRGAAKLVR